MAITECPHKTIREWSGCYEDCDYAGTGDCPHHNKRMTIDEAIKNLTALSAGRYKGGMHEARNAMKLGIEALEEIRYLQRMDADFKDYMLPSETKD